MQKASINKKIKEKFKKQVPDMQAFTKMGMQLASKSSNWYSILLEFREVHIKNLEIS